MSKESPDIFENGHIDIAHPLAKKFASYRISGEEWQILWVIMQKTWAWHKSWDPISLKQFWQITGMKKPSILRALNKLISKNIISKKANKNPYSWHINSHIDTWKIVSKKANVSTLANGVSKKANSVSKKAKIESLKGRPEKEEPIPKETSSKETSSKERRSSTVTKQKPKINFNFNTRRWENILSVDKNSWEEAYPACDIEAELRKMGDWLVSNPKKKKVNYRRFITNWLITQQDKGGTRDGKSRQTIKRNPREGWEEGKKYREIRKK